MACVGEAASLKGRPGDRVAGGSTYVLWLRGVARLPSVAVASLGLFSLLTAAILGWALLSQSMGGMSLLGLLIVLVSVFGVQSTSSR